MIYNKTYIIWSLSPFLATISFSSSLSLTALSPCMTLNARFKTALLSFGFIYYCEEAGRRGVKTPEVGLPGFAVFLRLFPKSPVSSLLTCQTFAWVTLTFLYIESLCPLCPFNGFYDDRICFTQELRWGPPVKVVGEVVGCVDSYHWS